MQHFCIILYYFKKGKNATETHKKIYAVYGEGAVTDRMCQKWFVKFHAGDFLLDTAPRSGRTAEVDRDRVETLIETNQCSTTQEVADILKISTSIKLLVTMKNLPFNLQKTAHGLFGQPSNRSILPPRFCGVGCNFSFTSDFM